jgi:hypothetical protein
MTVAIRVRIRAGRLKSYQRPNPPDLAGKKKAAAPFGTAAPFSNERSA